MAYLIQFTKLPDGRTASNDPKNSPIHPFLLENGKYGYPCYRNNIMVGCSEPDISILEIENLNNIYNSSELN